MRVTVGCHTFVLPAHAMWEHLSSEANAYWSTLNYILLINRHQRGSPDFNTLEGICRHQTQLDPLSESEKKKKTVDNAYFSLPLYLSEREGILKDFNSSITCNLCMAFLSYSLHIFRWLRDDWRRFVSSSFTRVATFIFNSICLTWPWFTAAAVYVGVHHPGVILDYTPDPFNKKTIFHTPPFF